MELLEITGYLDGTVQGFRAHFTRIWYRYPYSLPDWPVSPAPAVSRILESKPPCTVGYRLCLSVGQCRLQSDREHQ